MEKITEKRKEIEMDLIKVLRDFDDEELYKITIKYAKITKEKKAKRSRTICVWRKKINKNDDGKRY